VYSPAIGKICRTVLAVRNIRISFFKSRLIVLGKSFSIGFFLSTSCFDLITGAARYVLNFFGNENMANDTSNRRAESKTSPNHHAPIPRGSVGDMFGVMDRSVYSRVQNDPSKNPRAGPRIRTPIVMVKYYGDSLPATLSSMYEIPNV
jgi:hypothetical protein